MPGIQQAFKKHGFPDWGPSGPFTPPSHKNKELGLAPGWCTATDCGHRRRMGSTKVAALPRLQSLPLFMLMVLSGQEASTPGLAHCRSSVLLYPAPCSQTHFRIQDFPYFRKIAQCYLCYSAKYPGEVWQHSVVTHINISAMKGLTIHL